MRKPRPRAVSIPSDSCLPDQLPRIDFADAHAVALPPEASTDPRVWLDRLFNEPPQWARLAMSARNRLVRVIGLKASRRGDLPPLAEFACTNNEVILGLDDRHLNFRVSAYVGGRHGKAELTIGTAVYFNNLLGRLYFVPVRPIHPVIIRSTLAKTVALPATR